MAIMSHRDVFAPVVELNKFAAALHRRRLGRRIVLTSGCFDVLHVGHVRYLRQARRLGDLLVVGINSDDSVRTLKGPERPINSMADRAEILAALSCVDLVTIFSELTPHRLIELTRPDVFVKGGDYRLEDLPERELVEALGGRVVIVDHVRGASTTSLIGTIRNRAHAPRGRHAPGAGTARES